jgi:hypothetical protein
MTELERSPRLVLGIGVVDASTEVSPEIVRSGRLEMSELAEAYQQEARKAASERSAAETRAARPRFAEVMPAAAATLMLPPVARRGRASSGAATVMLSAVSSAALIAGAFAATLYAML